MATEARRAASANLYTRFGEISLSNSFKSMPWAGLTLVSVLSAFLQQFALWKSQHQCVNQSRSCFLIARVLGSKGICLAAQKGPLARRVAGMRSRLPANCPETGRKLAGNPSRQPKSVPCGSQFCGPDSYFVSSWLSGKRLSANYALTMLTNLQSPAFSCLKPPHNVGDPQEIHRRKGPALGPTAN